MKADDNGMTAFDHACENHWYEDCVKYLISKFENKLKLGYDKFFGRSALMSVGSNDNLEIFKVMVSHFDKDSLHNTDNQGRNILAYLLNNSRINQKNSNKVIDFIIENYPELITLDRFKNGQTLLNYACLCRHQVLI